LTFISKPYESFPPTPSRLLLPDLLDKPWRIKSFPAGVSSALPKIVEREWSNIFPLHAQAEPYTYRVVYKKNNRIWIRLQIENSASVETSWPFFIKNGIPSQTLNNRKSPDHFLLLHITTQTDLSTLILLSPRLEFIGAFPCHVSQMAAEKSEILSWFQELFPNEPCEDTEIPENLVNWGKIETRKKSFEKLRVQIPNVSFILKLSLWLFLTLFIGLYLFMLFQKNELDTQYENLQSRLLKEKKLLGLSSFSANSLAQTSEYFSKSSKRLWVLHLLSKELTQGTRLSALSSSEASFEVLLESSSRDGLFSVQDKLKSVEPKLAFGDLEKRIDNGVEFYRLPLKYTF
jgi:hypothetical protein